MQLLARPCVALALVCLLGSASGCAGQGTAPAAGPPPPPAGSAAAPNAEHARGELPDSGWGRARVAQVSLTLELPDAAAWRESASTGWARIDHARSHSRLELSLTRAERLVRPEDCEARARLGHPELPRPKARRSTSGGSRRLPDSSATRRSASTKRETQCSKGMSRRSAPRSVVASPFISPRGLEARAQRTRSRVGSGSSSSACSARSRSAPSTIA